MSEQPAIQETLEQQWLRMARGIRDQNAEPTEAMWDAAWKASQDYFASDKVTAEGFRRGLSAMISAMPKATLGWDADGLCDDHNRFGCKECALTPPPPAGADDGIA